MNDTPRPDEWETYCDESYYHLWRVRRKNERGFNDGYHVHNGNEARALVDLLNKQDSELNAVTDQRDRLVEAHKLIAGCLLYDELDDEQIERADFETGYDELIKISRKALAAMKGGSDE